MILRIASIYAVKFACNRYHYAKSVPSAQVAYSVFNSEDVFCGVVVFGPGATPNLSSPYNKWTGQVLELVRVALNGKQEKTSNVLAMSINLLKKDAPLVDLVVSYADVDQDHIGIIYQATNWIYTGVKNVGTTGAYIINGKKQHPRTLGSKGYKQSLEWLKLNIDKNTEKFITKGKHKYLMPLNKKTRKQVSILSQPYPKRSKQAMDNTNYSAEGQNLPERSIKATA